MYNLSLSNDWIAKHLSEERRQETGKWDQRRQCGGNGILKFSMRTKEQSRRDSVRGGPILKGRHTVSPTTIACVALGPIALETYMLLNQR